MLRTPRAACPYPVSGAEQEVAMDIVHPRAAGIDVHKKIIWVAVRLPGERPGERALQVKRCATFWRPLQQMAAWLAGLGVTDVAMESIGVIPGFKIAEIGLCRGGAVADVSATVAVRRGAGCVSVPGGARRLRQPAETAPQHQVLAPGGLESVLQADDLLAVTALELGELSGERGDDAGGLVRRRGAGPGESVGVRAAARHAAGCRSCRRGTPVQRYGRLRRGRGR